MKNAMGIILTGGNKPHLSTLSSSRSSSAVPIGGKYRAIDFPLSNMVNSGVTNIGVLTQYSFRSLMDHLGSGKEWDLDRRTKGLFIFPPYLSDENSGWYKGSADAMYNNMTFLKRSDEEYVIISSGNCVYKMMYDEMLKTHIESKADITIAYREMSDFSKEDLIHLGLIEIDKNNRITDFQEKPLIPKSILGSMGIYIFKRDLLISLLQETAARGEYDFVKDVIIKKLHSLNVFGYKFSGYWRNISCVKLFYKCNMEFLNPEICNELFREQGKIYTKVKDVSPTKYNEEAEVRNSVIGDGCIIEGIVENSVLFRGVTVKKGTIIKDSIIMQNTSIEEDANIEYAILDKNVVITKNKVLKGDLNWPMIVSKGAIV